MLELKEVIYVSVKKQQYAVFFSYLGLSVLLVGTGIFSLKDYPSVAVYLFVAFGVLTLFLIIGSILNQIKRFMVDFEEVGIIRLANESIELKKHTVLLEEIKQLELQIHNYKDGREGKLGFPINNFLMIETNDGAAYEVRFEIDYNPDNSWQNGSKKQFNQLQELLLAWYKYGVPVTESIGNTKTHGLKFLRYKELREFKERYLSENTH